MNVLEALARHYDRLHASGCAPPYGFSRERIAYAIVLSDAGDAVAVSPLSERSDNAPGPTVCEVPHAVRRTSRPVANFLWDKTAYVLGAKPDAATRKACPAHREYQAFQALHEALLSGAEDDGLRALLRFLRAWDPNDYGALRGASGNGRLRARHHVRAHWKRQAFGPQLSHRRWIVVEPYARGPAPAQNQIVVTRLPERATN